jgi:hypothetical protein
MSHSESVSDVCDLDTRYGMMALTNAHKLSVIERSAF